ncbi:glycosyltransferase family 2 protein [Microbacterium sp.]|uniref:glycosyltransferase family 2 protein n=1 Tax=Microbacterium sp. TaxID=51671 RepID=UPI00342082C7
MGRPSLRAAVESVRAQTGVVVRLHVVLDDPAAEAEVAPLLRDAELIVTPGRTGGANARNLGLRASTGRWVAYLDDDDWWEPAKLSVQLAAMEASASAVGLCGAVFHETGGGTRLLPRSEPVSTAFADYIVARPDLTFGRSLVQSSCLMVDRSRALDLEWDVTMPKHQDWDYALRLVRSGAHVGFAPQPLVHIQQGSSGSISNLRAWEASREWFERHSDAMSSRGRGDFVASHILRSALASRNAVGVRYALGHLLRSRPHAAAVITGLSGLKDALTSRTVSTDGLRAR